MTDDLVTRLRKGGSYEVNMVVMEEAAYRIEKLEAALRKYADEEYNGYNADGAHARKALEGKDD